MVAAVETMKKYLVEIGWDIDKEGFKKSLGIVNSTASKLTGKAAGIASSFIKAGGAVANVLITVNESLLNVVETTAELDLKTERLARQYWTTEQNARSFSTALKVLGKSTSDLMYMTSEEYKQFVELNKLGRTLDAPSGLDKYLQQVRALNFEVNRLKMIFQYGTRWVTYWISMFTGKDVDSFTKKLRNLGDFVIKNIQPITKAIAKFFEIFYRLGKAGVKILTVLGKVIFYVVDLFDSQVARVILIIGVLSKVLLASPINMFIGALVMLLLLIDDYMTWKRGGDSAFDWSEFDESISDLKKSLGELKDSLQPIKDDLDHIWNEIFGDTSKINIIQNFVDTVASGLNLISSALSDITYFIDLLSGKESLDGFLGKKSKIFDWLEENTGLFKGPIGWLFGRGKWQGEKNLFERIAGFFSSGSTAAGAMTYGGNTTNSTTTVTNNFNIYGNDASSIGNEVAGRLRRMYPTRSPY